MWWQTVFSKGGHTIIFIPAHLFFLQCDRYFSNWEVIFSPFESERGTCDSFDQQSTAEVIICVFWGTIIKRIQLPSGGLSLRKLLEPRNHDETTCEYSSWACSKHSINFQTTGRSLFTSIQSQSPVLSLLAAASEIVEQRQMVTTGFIRILDPQEK